MRSAPFLRMLLAFTAGLSLLSPLRSEDPVSFTRDIRPILSNNCFHCHGPDENTREADLRLDTRDGLLDFGPVVAGSVADSELFRRITAHDTDELMPPPESNKRLTDEQIRLLKRWIEQGATWEQHWSFRQPVDHPVPDANDDRWCRNEIDHFILRRLQQAGLQPAPMAAPDVLLRRVFLDLTGLPPAPEQATHWRQRIWPNADAPPLETEWAALVDELMASPHYGERWARRWLDLARYADTNGYEKDRDRSMWPYRDWVIQAINSGMPFDRFTIEQLAGDMLPQSTPQQRVATGFHRNTMLNEEGGIDPLEFRYHAMTDRVATTGTTWLGLTLGCCQCHTHKYDPVSHTEYFQVFAYLNNADEPYIELSTDELERTYQQNLQQAGRLLRNLEVTAASPKFAPINAPLQAATAAGQQSILVAENRVTVSGASPPTATYSVTLQPQADFQTLQLIATTPTGTSGPGRTPHGNFVLSEISLQRVRPDGQSTPVPILSATADAEQPGHTVDKAFDGRASTGWAIHTSSGVPQTATATFTLEPQAVADGDSLVVTLQQQTGGQHTLGQFQLLPGAPATAAAADTRRQESRLAAWLQSEQNNTVRWRVLRPTQATSNLPLLTIEDDDAIFASGDTAKRDDYKITLAPSEQPIHAIRLEALPDERLPARGPGTTYYEGTIGDFYLTEIQFAAAGVRYPVRSASHSFARNRFGRNPATAALAIDGDIQTGWSVHGRQGERHVAVFVLDNPIPPGEGVTIQMSFGRHFASSLGRFRFAASDATSSPQARDWPSHVADLLARPPSSWSAAEHQQVTDTFLLSQPQFREQADRIRKLQQRPSAVTSLVMQERPDGHPRPTYRHHRGEYLQPQERVSPGLPSVLQTSGSSPASRLEFARWIVSNDNPLTARVVANRHWAALFGTGIVKTLDDFGLQGEAPSHPELLDWLAVRLRTDDAWSVRKLHRRIVTSATYRQSSAVNPQAVTTDPDNRLLSYAPRFVLDAEIIRDQLLMAAGILSPEVGGPPVRPPQPVGVTEAAYGRPKWNASAGASRYRRSLYTFAKRTAPFAMFATFDAPSGEACIARRNRSNSPLQALTLLNDVMLMDIAQQSGRRLAATSAADNLSQAEHDQQQLTDLFRRTLVRSPTAAERDMLLTFLHCRRSDFLTDVDQAREFAQLQNGDQRSAADVAEVAAWTAVSRTLFGLDETLTRE